MYSCMKTLLALLVSVIMVSCGSAKDDNTVEVTDTLNAGDTAVEMLDTIGDSINVMRQEAEQSAGQR